jgi:hypothetical protein
MQTQPRGYSMTAAAILASVSSFDISNETTDAVVDLESLHCNFRQDLISIHGLVDDIKTT